MASTTDVVVFLLAIPVHGLVHVVAPGPVPARAGARTRAAALARARAPAPTPRAPGAARAAAAAHALAPDTEVMGNYNYIYIIIFHIQLRPELVHLLTTQPYMPKVISSIPTSLKHKVVQYLAVIFISLATNPIVDKILIFVLGVYHCCFFFT